MFGYVKPDRPYLYLKDETLYNALYCGVCKSIGKVCGQRARIGLTYDIAFLSALVHNLKGIDITISKERCVAHSIVGRPMASRDEITELMACVNVALAYHKVKDDINDGVGGKLKSFLFAKGFKRTLKFHPAISDIIEHNYNELCKLEKAKEDRLDAVCEPFSLMMKELGNYVLGDISTGQTDDFFYFFGKWIYLIDALDDYDKDIKKGNYNPLYYAFGQKSSVKQLKEECANDISFAFSDIFARLSEDLKSFSFKFNHDLIDNIVLRGLPQMTMNILKKVNKDDR